jgi:DICT domain-containing protein
VFLILYLFYDYHYDTFDFDNKLAQSVHLSLLKDRSINLMLELKCDIGIEGKSDWIVEFFGGPAFRVEVGKSSIELLLGHRNLKDVEIITFNRSQDRFRDSCTEIILYSQQNQSITYIVAETKKSVKISKPY